MALTNLFLKTKSSVYCAVRTGSLSTIQINIKIKKVISLKNRTAYGEKAFNMKCKCPSSKRLFTPINTYSITLEIRT
jgi:hypothetical protein